MDSQEYVNTCVVLLNTSAMPKRFTDTDKWKKPFIRGLQGPYKLLWFYILDDCDHAGIWQVDFEVARIRIGEQVDGDQALKLFGDRIVVIEKFKWFVPDFIRFQYGELNEKNRAHASVMAILKNHKVLTSPLQGAKDKDKDMDMVKDKDKDKKSIEKEIFENETFITDLQSIHKGKDLREAWEQCWTHHIQKPRPPTESWEWRQKLNSWLINVRTERVIDKPNAYKTGKLNQ